MIFFAHLCFLFPVGIVFFNDLLLRGPRFSIDMFFFEELCLPATSMLVKFINGVGEFDQEKGRKAQQ